MPIAVFADYPLVAGLDAADSDASTTEMTDDRQTRHPSFAVRNPRCRTIPLPHLGDHRRYHSVWGLPFPCLLTTFLDVRVFFFDPLALARAAVCTSVRIAATSTPTRLASARSCSGLSVP